MDDGSCGDMEQDVKEEVELEQALSYEDQKPYNSCYGVAIKKTRSAFCALLALIVLANCNPQASPFTPSPRPTAQPSPTLTPIDYSKFEEIDRIGDGTIADISLSPNGEDLAVITSVGIWVYKISDGSVLFFNDSEAPANIYGVSFIEWSADGDLLAVGRKDNGIWIWETESWDLITELEGKEIGDSYPVFPGFAWSHDGSNLLLGQGDQEIQIWNRASNSWDLYSVEEYQAGVAWTRLDEPVLITYDGIVNVLTGELRQNLGYTHGTEAIAIPASDFHYLFKINAMYGLAEGSLIDIQKNKVVLDLSFCCYGGAKWSPDGRYFAYVDNQINVWDSQTGELAAQDLVAEHVNAITWTQEGKLLAAGLQNDRIALWDVDTDKTLMDLSQHTDLSSATRVDSAGGQQNFILDTYDDKVVLWSLERNGPIVVQAPQKVDNYDYSGDGQVLVTVDEEGYPLLWNMENGEPLLNFNEKLGQDDFFLSLASNGKYLATEDDFYNVKIWNIAQAEVIKQVQVSESTFDLDWSPDGRAFYEVNWEASSEIFSLDDDEVRSIPGEVLSTFPVWSPDGSQLAFVNLEFEPGIYDLQTKLIVPIETEDYVDSFLWTPDGQNLVRLGGDYFESCTLSFWDARNGELTRTIEFSCSGSLGWITFSPDGAVISAQGDNDGMVYILDLESGELLTQFDTRHQIGYHLVWAADSRKFYTTGYDGTIRVWGVP